MAKAILTKSTISIHDDLALLSVIRPQGSIRQAFFESKFAPIIEAHQWRVTHDQIESIDGIALQKMLSRCYNCSAMRIESNEDYTRKNFYLKHPNGRSREFCATIAKLPRKQKALLYHAPLKYRSRNEWVEMDVEVEAKRFVKIKINKYLVKYLPMKMVYRPEKNGLYFWPNKEQRKRFRPTRHGGSIAHYLLAKAEYPTYTPRRLDSLDYRIDDMGKFVASIEAKNEYTDLGNGLTQLMIYYPPGYLRAPRGLTMIDASSQPYIYPQAKYLNAGDERWCFVVFDTKYLHQVTENHWVFDNDEVYSHDSYKYQIMLKRFLAKQANLDIGRGLIPSRMTKYYLKAVDGGMDEKAMKKRARFENTEVGDITTNNRTHTKPREIVFRQVHANKIYSLPSGYVACDMRIESLKVGGAINDDTYSNDKVDGEMSILPSL